MTRKLTLERATAINRRRALRDGGPSFEVPVERVHFIEGRASVGPSYGIANEPLAIAPAVLEAGRG